MAEPATASNTLRLKKPGIINPGCVVRLKHGGVPMTVESIEDDVALCVWFDETQALHRQAIALIALDHLRD